MLIAQRMAQLRALAPAQHQRQGGEEGRQGGHDDRPEAQQRRLVDRLARALALLALGVEGEVDHHDGVLLHDADQQDDADDADHAQVLAGDHQGQQRADAGRGQGREDGDRVDVALVEHAQHDVDGDDRRQDQPQLVGQRGLVGVGGAQEGGGDAGRHADLRFSSFWIALTAAPSETPGAVSNEMLAAGNWATWLTCSGAVCCLDGGDAPTAASARRWRRSCRGLPGPAGVLIVVGVGLEDHPVLAGLGEDGRDDPLAEGVVERVVDRRRRDRRAARPCRGRCR